MKYYIVLAINKQNPKIIKGLCENSFSMSWEDNKVKLWIANHKEQVKYNNDIENGKIQSSEKSEPIFTGYIGSVKGRDHNEYIWRYCLDFALKRCNTLGKGWELKKFRVNSKYCPIKVDLKTREGMRKKIIKYDKYLYRNVYFDVL